MDKETIIAIVLAFTFFSLIVLSVVLTSNCRTYELSNGVNCSVEMGGVRGVRQFMMCDDGKIYINPPSYEIKTKCSWVEK